MKIDVFAQIHPPDYSRRVRRALERPPDSPLLEEWDLMLAEDPAPGRAPALGRVRR